MKIIFTMPILNGFSVMVQCTKWKILGKVICQVFKQTAQNTLCIINDIWPLDTEMHKLIIRLRKGQTQNKANSLYQKPLDLVLTAINNNKIECLVLKATRSGFSQGAYKQYYKYITFKYFIFLPFLFNFWGGVFIETNACHFLNKFF